MCICRYAKKVARGTETKKLKRYVMMEPSRRAVDQLAGCKKHLKNKPARLSIRERKGKNYVIKWDKWSIKLFKRETSSTITREDPKRERKDDKGVSTKPKRLLYYATMLHHQ